MEKEDLIKFTGLNKLEPTEQAEIQRLSTEYFPKIKRSIHNITCLEIHIKTHEHEGGRCKYSFHIRCIYPGRTLETNKHHDFNLAVAAHSAFKALLREIEHAHHSK